MKRAPDFRLPSGPGTFLSLADLRGKPVILVFYPADWSPVCGDQLALYNEVLPEFEKYGAQLVGISVDGPWCHAAYAKSRNLRFPLLCDFEPKGEVARHYGFKIDPTPPFAPKKKGKVESAVKREAPSVAESLALVLTRVTIE